MSKIAKPAKVAKPTTTDTATDTATTTAADTATSTVALATNPEVSKPAKPGEISREDALEIFAGAYNASRAEGGFATIIVRMYQKYGSNRMIREFAICGRIADTLNIEDDAEDDDAETRAAKIVSRAAMARAILDLPGAGSQADNRRTKEQEEHYTNARAWLSRVLKRAGVETHENRGGARPQSGKSKTTSTTPPAADAPKPGDQTIMAPPVVPDVVNKPIDPTLDDETAIGEVTREIRRHAKACLDLVNSNAKRKGAAQIAALVTRFYADVSKLILEDELTV